MNEAIFYARVSSQQQGKSGLGLEAQRTAVEAFCNREGFTIAQSFTDIESGAKDDRTGLSMAIALSKSWNAPIIVAKLDRLGRSVHFISGLMAHNVRFIVAELGADIPTFCLHMFAAIAEQERKMISERTSAALKAASARGTKLGIAIPSVAAQVLPKARAAVRAKGQATWDRLEFRITAATNDSCTTNRDFADWLNTREVYTPRGNPWTKRSISPYLRRWKAERDERNKQVHGQ